MYIAISIILIVSFGLISFLKLFSKFRKKHADFYNYSITVVGVFLGVFIAIHINNISVIKTERNKVEKLLQSSVEELSSIIMEVEVVQSHIYSESKNIKMFLSNNSMPFPRTFPRLLNNEYILKHIYGSTYRVLNTNLRSLEKYYTSISNVREIMSFQDSKLYQLLDEYRQELECAKAIITIESEYIGNNNNRKKFDKLIDEILISREDF